MKSMQGVVKSIADSVTAYVLVERTVVHPKYGKRLKRSSKFVADNTKGAKTGDKVVLVETRPISKRKCWAVAEVING